MTRSPTERPGPPAAADGVRYLAPRVPDIVRATDLGSVQVLKHGNLFLLTDQFGDIHADSRGLGLYRLDTRILSCAILRVNGARPTVLQSQAGENYHGVIELEDPAPLPQPGARVEPEAVIDRHPVGITRDRLIGDGLREEIRVANYTEQSRALALELRLGVDAADIFEVRGYPRDGRGELLPIAVADGRVTFGYRGLDGRLRRTFVRFTGDGEVVALDGDPRDGSVAVHWRWELAPREQRTVEWHAWSATGAARDAAAREVDGSAEPSGDAPFPPPPPISPDDGASAYRTWTNGTSPVQSSHEVFDRTIRRSVADLRLLINDGPREGERYVAAGVPWFTTLFGRDALITALQLIAFRPQLAIETLAVLAARQATEVDDWRDAEPGKILHELRNGEMAQAGELPFSPYYGSVDATPLWLILLSEAWEWTGDRSLVDRHWPNVLAALRWIDEFGDRDGDGFVEYGRRSSRGLLNQGWKDSGDSMRDRTGRRVEPPIALAEVQGYVFDAKVRIARLARIRGDDELAARLETEAETIRGRFEEAFWVDDQRYYAMALDAEKHQADALGSNAGHCLWSGIASPERARRVADRLLGPELYSGWGVRTYGAGQPGYNPIGYHTGTVWPHDNSIIAAGLKRYGFHDEANRIIGQVFEVAQHFPEFRLPELYCGFARDGGSVPVPYPVACSPQAWAAGSAFLFLQTMLGLRAHADRRELELWRPDLPEWLQSVRVSNVRVADASVDLLFHRWRGTTSAEVLRKVGDISVTIRL